MVAPDEHGKITGMTELLTKRQRIVTLDILRGFFMLTMIADHLHFFPGLFEWLTGRGELWVSAAEGFFMVSGLLVGYIYAPKMVHHFASSVKKIWRRAAVLYAVSVGLTVTAVFWAQHATGPIKEGLWTNPRPLEFIYKVITLQYSYGWADFLQYYVLFMIVAPLAAWLCIHRKAWVVLATSLLVYLFRGNNFNMAWQLMFMGGLVIGYYLPWLEEKAKALTPRTKRIGTATLVTLTVLTIVTSATIIHGGMIINALAHMQPNAWWAHARDNLNTWNYATAPYTTKWTLEPPRIILALLWISTLYILIRPREGRVDQITAGFLSTVGSAALFVYGAHALVIMGVHMWLPASLGYALNTVVTAIFLVTFYFIAKYRLFVIKTIPAWLKQTTTGYNGGPRREKWKQQKQTDS